MPSISTRFVTALALGWLAAPALAQEPRVFAVETNANFCPAGLQPVTLNGVICCGRPNQAQTYQHAMRHPVSHRVRNAVARHDGCAPGIKGCS